MATLVLTEKELSDRAEAARASKALVTIEPGLLMVLAYHHGRYQEIAAALEQAACGGKFPTVVQDVTRLIGEHQALGRFAEGTARMPGSALPRALRQWQDWASLLLMSLGEPVAVSGDVEETEVLQDKLGELCGQLDAATRRAHDQAEVLAHENRDLWVKLRAWEDWAEQAAPKCTSDHEQRQSITARLKSG